MEPDKIQTTNAAEILHNLSYLHELFIWTRGFLSILSYKSLSLSLSLSLSQSDPVDVIEHLAAIRHFMAEACQKDPLSTTQ